MHLRLARNHLRAGILVGECAFDKGIEVRGDDHLDETNRTELCKRAVSRGWLDRVVGSGLEETAEQIAPSEFSRSEAFDQVRVRKLAVPLLRPPLLWLEPRLTDIDFVITSYLPNELLGDLPPGGDTGVR